MPLYILPITPTFTLPPLPSPCHTLPTFNIHTQLLHWLFLPPCATLPSWACFALAQHGLYFPHSWRRRTFSALCHHACMPASHWFSMLHAFHHTPLRGGGGTWRRTGSGWPFLVPFLPQFPSHSPSSLHALVAAMPTMPLSSAILLQHASTSVLFSAVFSSLFLLSWWDIRRHYLYDLLCYFYRAACILDIHI